MKVVYEQQRRVNDGTIRIMVIISARETYKVLMAVIK